MGWLDNLWRRRQGRATETPADTARIREQQKGDDRAVADQLEERAHAHREDEIFREPRKPPGTG
jgi:hypothetical protein